MFKFIAMVSLMLIGSAIWASGLSCDSCGSECASACGTRHFRACCFNYLRRKRGPELMKMWTPKSHESMAEIQKAFSPKSPALAPENLPSFWSANSVANEMKAYPFDDTPENLYQVVYEP